MLSQVCVSHSVHGGVSQLTLGQRGVCIFQYALGVCVCGQGGVGYGQGHPLHHITRESHQSGQYASYWNAHLSQYYLR